MAAGDIYRKTEKGQAEIRDRKLKLSPRLRTMLILIDGTQPEFLLKEEGTRLGAPPDFLQQLVASGLVERIGAVQPAGTSPGASVGTAAPAADEYTRFREAKQFMNTTIVDALGIKSFFFTMKLERAGVTADLVELIEPYEQAMAKAEGEEHAEVLVKRLREMLH